ncbi:MAG: glycoside hydrolase family 13 protein [Oscillospiraceae bacterium]|nr:glycoside hydrolase family 13 protein [Oscillospiraceae bacterium]
MDPIFHAQNLTYKSPFGAVPAGTPVRFCLDLPKDGSCSQPQLLACADGGWAQPKKIPLLLQSALPQVNRFEAVFTPEKPALLFYRFSFLQAGAEVDFFSDENGGATRQGGRWWQLTVYDPGYRTPDFIKGGLYYQIFPDRFCRSETPKQDVPDDRVLHPDFGGLPEFRPNAEGKILNNDYFGGDLVGITQKIPYLRELGVTCLYLNPIFEAHSNHRYNTANYKRIDPLLGTLADFKALCSAAHEAGISVILDGVFSHTGSDSVYFNREGRYGDGGAFRDPESPYRKWYQFDEYPNRYRSWWGIDTLPNVEEEEPSYLDFICSDEGVLEFWMDLGADGFRLDVADELPDCFLDAVRRRLKRHGAHLLIGEVWEDASNKIAYGLRRRYLLGDQLDGVMNYPLGSAILSFVRYGGGQDLSRTVWAILENYPPQTVAVLMNSLSTHDIPRAITVLAGEPYQNQDREWQAAHHFLAPEAYETGKKRLRLATLLQYLLPGVPCLYYGDEAGLSGYRDPFNRCPYPWGQADVPLLDWFCRLGELRRTFRELLADGDYLPVQWSQDLFCFLRRKGSQALLTAVNRGDAPCRILLPGSDWQVLLGQADGGTLAAGEGVVFLCHL